MLASLASVASIAGGLLRCKTCLAVLAAIALLFGGGLYGVSVEKARSEARIERMKREADAAARKRDAEIADALEQKYRPVISNLNAEKATLQQKVKDHAKRKPVKAGAAPAACKLGDAAGLLRRREPQ